MFLLINYLLFCIKLLSSMTYKQAVDLGRMQINFPAFFCRQVCLRRPDEKVMRAASGPWAIVWRPLAYENVCEEQENLCIDEKNLY